MPIGAARAGPVSLLLADPGTGFYTLSAMPEAWGSGFIDNAYSDSPPPHVFLASGEAKEGEELSATFLDVRGRPEEPEQKQSSGSKFS